MRCGSSDSIFLAHFKWIVIVRMSYLKKYFCTLVWSELEDQGWAIDISQGATWEIGIVLDSPNTWRLCRGINKYTAKSSKPSKPLQFTWRRSRFLLLLFSGQLAPWVILIRRVCLLKTLFLCRRSPCNCWMSCCLWLLCCCWIYSMLLTCISFGGKCWSFQISSSPWN